MFRYFFLYIKAIFENQFLCVVVVVFFLHENINMTKETKKKKFACLEKKRNYKNIEREKSFEILDFFFLLRFSSYFFVSFSQWLSRQKHHNIFFSGYKHKHTIDVNKNSDGRNFDIYETINEKRLFF